MEERAMADAAPRQLRRPRRCYICRGGRTILVSEWHGDEVTRIETTCVRCQGSGVITDEFGVKEILELGSSSAPQRQRPCICVFDRDGPMGNPACPAR